MSKDSDKALHDACAAIAEVHDKLQALNVGMKVPSFADTFELQFVVARAERGLNQFLEARMAERDPRHSL